MKKGIIYMVVLALCMIILSILLYKNYIQFNKMKEKQSQLYLLHEREENKGSFTKQFGYVDILKALEFKDAVKIERFNQQNEGNTANVSIQILGDIINVSKILENVQRKENFKALNNIILEKNGENAVNIRANIDFIKNK